MFYEDVSKEIRKRMGAGGAYNRNIFVLEYRWAYKLSGGLVCGGAKNRDFTVSKWRRTDFSTV